jgi:hypothetical protein
MPNIAIIEEVISRTITESITNWEQITPASPSNRDGVIIFAPAGALAIRLIETGGTAPTGAYAPDAATPATLVADFILDDTKSIEIGIQDRIDVYAAAVSGTACAVLEEYK